MNTSKIDDSSSVLLCHLAPVIRSKNAGPFLLTFDVMFDNQESFDRVWSSGDFDKQAIAEQFEVPVEHVLSIFAVPNGLAIKLTLRRPQPQGCVGESDMYGCQQHVPLMYLPINPLA